ncbi:hypothetical protein FQN50_000281 [Emmonsiellopsis sp. PD_5]|nr:hypothetical protein FQN50_000281 [Emmonsiellopsis sp. PD_5]
MAHREPAELTENRADQDSSVKRVPGDTLPERASAPPKSDEAPRRKTYLSSGKQITRSRVSKSCHTCRRRKVKCDTVHPICGTCEKTKSECHYSSRPFADPSSQPRHDIVRDSSSHGNKRRRELSEPIEDVQAETLSPYNILKEIQRGQEALREQYSDSQAIAARLDELSAIVAKWNQTHGPRSLEELNMPLQRGGQVSGAGVTSDSIKDPSDTTSAPLGAPKPQFRQTSQTENSSGDDFPIPSGLETDLVDPIGSLNIGHLSLEDGGKSRYVGTTYWAYISREINELNRLLRGQTRSRDISPSPSDGSQSMDEDYLIDSTVPSHVHGSRKESFHKSVLFPFGDSPTSQDKSIEPYMLENMPTKRQSRILYKGFMSGVHAISPVVHPPSILEKYHAFWEWYEVQGQTCPDPSFIPLLYAIWYGGSVTISRWTIHEEFDIENRAALSSLYHDEVTRWLRKISFPRNPSLHGLMAFLLVQTILSREEEPLASSLFISLALRVAQTMGLHRDPAQFGISAREAETRRRVWWHIVHMDGVVAMSSGLPPLVNDDNYWDVRITSEVKDTLLDTPSAAEYDRMVDREIRKPDCPSDPNICGGQSMVNVYYLCAKGKYVMAQATRKILKIQLGTKPVTRKDMEDLRSILLELQSRLRSIIDRIPVSKATRPISRDGHNYNSAPSCSSTEIVPGDFDSSIVGPSCLEQYHSPVLVAFHKWAKILLSLFIDKAYVLAYQPFLKNARSKIWPAARQRALRACHGFMEKFISLATDPDFQSFQWSWPGIMLIDLYERPRTSEAAKSRDFIDKIFSLSGPDGGVVGGEDGISTSRPLRDGGREAWDMIRKAWLKAQAQTQANDVTATGRSGLGSSTRRSAMGLGEQTEPSIQSFADSYYTLIKEPHENKASNLPKHGKSLYEETATLSPTKPKWAYFSPIFPEIQTHTDNTRASWPSPPPFPSPSQYNTHPDSSGAFNIPAITSTKTDTNTNTNNNLPPFTDPLQPGDFPLIPPNPDIPIQPHQIPAAPSSAPDPATGLFGNPNPNPNPTSSPLDHNLHFDWDQWDAVFGPSLPVIDGLMHLDTVNPAGAGAGTGTMGAGAGVGSADPSSSAGFTGLGRDDVGGSFNAEGGGAAGRSRNWADFG